MRFHVAAIPGYKHGDGVTVSVPWARWLTTGVAIVLVAMALYHGILRA